MKALSVTQPWAQLIADGRKRIETRSWHSAYRGPLAIHASATKIDADIARGFGYDPPAIVRGAVIAIAELFHCQQMTSEWIELQTTDERRYGFYGPGRWAWHLRLLKVLGEPIPAKGHLQTWNIDIPFEYEFRLL
jgi:hypothetical protein